MPPGKWKQEEPAPGLTKLESKLVKDYVNQLEIVTYGILICIQRYKGTEESQLVGKSIYFVLKYLVFEFAGLFPKVELC